MMEISEQLRCLFSAEIEHRDGSYVVDVPDQEIQLDTLDEGSIYRVALLSTSENSSTSNERSSGRDRNLPEPPVEEGEIRRVEIEEIGDQGDGIAKVERGYVIVVPDTERGERVEIEITETKQNVAFAEVKERISYYE
jgi:predicted RNA-binding protein with TRAM domain